MDRNCENPIGIEPNHLKVTLQFRAQAKLNLPAQLLHKYSHWKSSVFVSHNWQSRHTEPLLISMYVSLLVCMWVCQHPVWTHQTT